MKRQLFVMSILTSFLFFGSMNWTSCTAKKVMAENVKETPAVEAPTPTPTAEPGFITAIKDKIKGKENEPAEAVFENIEILKGMPAGRVIPIMQRAFSQSLGVKCNHCHVRGNWASDDNVKKDVTRDMWRMSGKINGELLPSIANIESAQPVANCTTCHRGEIKPATSLQ
jgi:hypothetical protein